jgi:hypothetical protein
MPSVWFTLVWCKVIFPSYHYFFGISKGGHFRGDEAEGGEGKAEDEFLIGEFGALLEDVELDVPVPACGFDDPS